MRVLQISTYILKEVKSNVEKFYHILAKKCATESCNYVRITAALFLYHRVFHKIIDMLAGIILL